MDSEDININNAVRVSQVHNIDEEKLVFRVIVSHAADPGTHGLYSFNLPPITDICNSNEYNQAVIKIDQVNISPTSYFVGLAIINNPNPVWTTATAGPGWPPQTEAALSAVMLMLNLPSRQTGTTANNEGNANQQNHQIYYKHAELIPVEWKFRGNYSGIMPEQAAVPAGGSRAIYFSPNSDGVLCANPFGSEVRYNFKNPFDVGGDNEDLYLADAANNPGAGVARDDITDISIQFTITLIPNKTR